jgi:predicted transcriptional regulator
VKAYLALELTGDNVVQILSLHRRLLKDVSAPQEFVDYCNMPPSAWVAEITGFSKKYKFERRFLKYNKDFSKSNSKGSRGVYAEYILESGAIYQVKDDKWRYFCTVDESGNINRLAEEEVIQCLNNRLG